MSRNSGSGSRHLRPGFGWVLSIRKIIPDQRLAFSKLTPDWSKGSPGSLSYSEIIRFDISRDSIFVDSEAQICYPIFRASD